MNAHQRKRDRRAKRLIEQGRRAASLIAQATERANVTRLELEARVRAAETDAEKRRSTAQAEAETRAMRAEAGLAELGKLPAELESTLADLRALTLERDQDLDALGRYRERHQAALTRESALVAQVHDLTERLARAERQAARLEAEDRDPAKLRRRLRTAHDALAAAHTRIRELEHSREQRIPAAVFRPQVT